MSKRVLFQIEYMGGSVETLTCTTAREDIHDTLDEYLDAIEKGEVRKGTDRFTVFGECLTHVHECGIKSRNDVPCSHTEGHAGEHSWYRSKEVEVVYPPVPPTMNETELAEYRQYVPRDNREEE